MAADKISEGYCNLGRNDIEDVRWLCSLSETELDVLVSLKQMVSHRGMKIGRESLVRKFDLKTLRTLSLTMMERLRDHPVFAQVGEDLGKSNLLRSPISDSSHFSSMSSEELWMAYLCPEKRRRIEELFADTVVLRPKRRSVSCDPLH